MSKYIDRLRSESPASLYVFNQETPGNVTDQGFTGNDLVLTENGVAAKSVPAIIPGEVVSVYPTVAYDYDTGSSTQEQASFKAAGYTEWDWFYGLENSWTIVAAFTTGYSSRSPSPDGPIWGFYDPTDAGVILGVTEVTDGWELAVKIGLQSGETTLITHEVGYGEFVHAVLTNIESYFTLIVNGEIVGTAEVDSSESLLSGMFSDFDIAGEDAENHSNVSALGAVALFKHPLSYRRAEGIWELLDDRRAVSDIVAGFGPLDVEIPEGNSITVLAPELDDLFVGADSDLEYEGSTDSVMIKDSSLAAPVTAYKKVSYDLTEVETIGKVYHGFTETTGAASSVVAEYSFDDVTYSTLPQSADSIPEISQDWAQAAEGTL